MKTILSCGLFLAALSGCTLMPGQGADAYAELSDGDITLAANAMQNGLEQAHEGEMRSWQNPATGNAGAITVGRTFVDSAGSFCRDYRETIELSDGRVSTMDNTACRGNEGHWRWI